MVLLSLRLNSGQSPLQFNCCSGLKRSRKSISRKHPTDTSKTKTKTKTLSFPPSTPTPIVPNPKQPPHSQLEALVSVVDDIESSVSSRIHVDLEVFASVLETCYRLGAIEQGIRIHRLIPKSVLKKNHGVSSKLLRLYSANGLVEDAQDLFDQMSTRDQSAFAWNSLISGYTELGMYEDAIALYFQMGEQDVQPDEYTFPRVLKACAGIGSIRIGEAVHRHAVRSGFVNNGFISNALVDMYSKCGDIARARRVFKTIQSKSIVSWNSLLTAYIRHGLLVDAVNAFKQMIADGFQPDSVGVSSILSGISSFETALQVHGWVVRVGLEWNLSVVNSLIAIYSNNGRLENAAWLFANMPEKDVVSWNAIINAHSKSHDALRYYEQMQRANVLPDCVTFVSLLSTCTHLGLVSDGERLFSTMVERFRIKPGMEHYACMVNLYGRAGMVDQAYSIITERMEMEAGSTAWGALLHACVLHKNVEIGEIAAEKLFDLEPENEHNFRLLIKIYESAGMLDDVERIRIMLIERGL
ncbi:hypothetical protein MLD38_033584 [Melastoma candidum]|uniref:Uncharacterized protein n=1 Tax=Melastoma candidum TaxID=119954 RepID=A0ACB9M7C6_9MYRT|nr:hypothetical protein MLD38_033584 [Melastoma candidum]